MIFDDKIQLKVTMIPMEIPRTTIEPIKAVLLLRIDDFSS